MSHTQEIYIDIETCPTQDPKVRELIAAAIEPPANISKAETLAIWHEEKKPALIDKAILKTSFDGAYGHVAVIGLAFDNEEPIALYSEDWLADEKIILQTLYQMIDERVDTSRHRCPTFVGHNIIDFDFRFLFQRSVVLKEKPTPLIPFNATKWDGTAYDTMARWAGHRDYVDMDKLCGVFDIPGKGDMDGSKVWDAVREGRIDEVATYCIGDIERTRAIYKQMTFQV
jgi:hypothetical protein